MPRAVEAIDDASVGRDIAQHRGDAPEPNAAVTGVQIDDSTLLVTGGLLDRLACWITRC